MRYSRKIHIFTPPKQQLNKRYTLRMTAWTPVTRS